MARPRARKRDAHLGSGPTKNDSHLCWTIRHRERKKRGPLSAEGAAFVDVIDGKRDPHLFFPLDLFQELVGFAYSDNGQMRVVYRESKENERRAYGLPDNMWDRLEGIVAAYRAAELEDRAYVQSHKDRGHSADPTLVKLCRERYAALVEAQTTFGPKFTEFLYTAVAPHMRRSYLGKPDERILRTAKGDCQW